MGARGTVDLMRSGRFREGGRCGVEMWVRKLIHNSWWMRFEEYHLWSMSWLNPKRDGTPPHLHSRHVGKVVPL